MIYKYLYNINGNHFKQILVVYNVDIVEDMN